MEPEHDEIDERNEEDYDTWSPPITWDDDPDTSPDICLWCDGWGCEHCFYEGEV